MIKVYQIQLTNEEINLVNAGGDYTPKMKAYFGREFARTFEAENFQYYSHVANLETDDMEEAFELMNLWENESAIERVSVCRSMSVGDILEMEDGSKYRCASFGFELIGE